MEPDGNPLVAGYQDDLDSDEDLTQPLPGVSIAEVETENDPDDDVVEHEAVSVLSRLESPAPQRKLSTASSSEKKSINDEWVFLFFLI